MEYTFTILDENASVSLLLQHCLDQFPELCHISSASNPTQGLDTILKFSPDLVFINLDTNAAAYFLMVTELYKYTDDLPLFIGIAKGQQFAYEAIKNNFIDYWLQPFNEFEIRKSIAKFKRLHCNTPSTKTLCLKSYSDYHYVDTNEILFLKADNNTTHFIMLDGSNILAYKTLKTYENQLPNNFFRVHQSYILNINYVARITYGKSMCTLKMRKIQIPFSKSYKNNVDLINKILSKNTFKSIN